MNEGPDKGASLSAIRAAAAKRQWNRDTFKVVPAPRVNGHAIPSRAPAPVQINKPDAAEKRTMAPRAIVPYEQIVAAYEASMTSNPRVRVLSDKTKGLVRARWNEDKGRQNIAWWQQYFAYCNSCPHLIGKNDRQWVADFAWLVCPTNMEKVINGRYER